MALQTSLRSGTALLLALLACCWCLPKTARAQGNAWRTQLKNHWSVTVGADTLVNAWLGGLNYPRFANLDIDNDGLEDVLVFDREDNRLMILQQTGNGLVYRPEWDSLFPVRQMASFVFTEDADGDGDRDLITAGFGSFFRVFENIAPTGAPPQFNFTPLYNPVQTRYSPGNPPSDLYNLPTDVPAVKDLDFDGDLDFLVYRVGGGRLEYHKNMAVDSLGRTDTLMLVMASSCWGRFSEVYDPVTETYELLLNQPCAGEFKVAHAGGSVTALNLNADTLMDAIVSDLGTNYMVAVTNGGTRRFAEMTSQDVNFPSYDVGINLTTFPVAFYVDINGDQTRDLVVSPNSSGLSNDYSSIWHYRNNGQDNQPVFNLQAQDFLQSDAIDLGTGAAAAFGDLDADGLPDLLVGCQSRYAGNNQSRAGLVYFRNVGTPETPVFRREDDNFLELFTNPVSANFSYLRPALADLDKDGDTDLLLSRGNQLIRYRNDAGPGNPPLLTAVDSNFLNLAGNGPSEIAPCLYDFDNDNDPDLLLGGFDGKIWYYECTGQNPLSYSLVTQEFGNVRATDTVNSFFGRAAPTFLDIDNDFSDELLVGNTNGRVLVYDNVMGAAPTATFDSVGYLQAATWGTNLLLAGYPQVTRNADTSHAFLVGGMRTGGLNLMQITSHPGLTTAPETAPQPTIAPKFQLYPNPVSAGRLTLEYPTPQATVQVFAPDGRKVHEIIALPFHRGRASLSLPQLAPGVYILRLFTPEGSFAERLVVQHP